MIYLLKRVGVIGYDEYDAKVVRAQDEQAARAIANRDTGDEGKAWENPEKVICEVVLYEGEPGEILESFNAG